MNKEITLFSTAMFDCLKSIIRETVMECLQSYNEECKEEKECYLSKEKTAEILNCNKSTLWRWNKTGYLVSCKFGGKVMYKKTDVDNILNQKPCQEL